MSRYIDADALKAYLIEHGFYPVFIQRAIENVPSVENAPSIEVVRCKDCVRKKSLDCPMFISGVKIDDDGFCHYGERGTENDGR